MLSSVSGKSTQLSLDLGGFGVSRYQFDLFLYEKAKEAGVTFLLDTEVDEILFADDEFVIKTDTQSLAASIAIGAFGKRSKLDNSLDRSF